MTPTTDTYAFPGPSAFSAKGMTLRDWFAGQALPAIVVATAAGRHSYQASLGSLEMSMAVDAYKLADAMLAACTVREQKP